MTMGTMVAIFIGGGTGATCRYLTGLFVRERYDGVFPLGTLLINTTGCFALGFLASLLATHTDAGTLSALLATGFLGGYTTFSTYALESSLLLNDRRRRLALANLLGSVALGVLAAALGAAVAQLS